MSLKQFKVEKDIKLGDYIFHIRPFPAFTAANVSGDLLAVLSPAVAGLAPLAASAGDSDVMNLDISTFSGALSGLSGDKLESLLKKLLTKHGNITAELDDDELNGGGEIQKLTNDLVDDIFCGSAQDMFILAFEVVKVNYNGFFEKVGGLFGFRKAQPTEKSTPTSTEN